MTITVKQQHDLVRALRILVKQCTGDPAVGKVCGICSGEEGEHHHECAVPQAQLILDEVAK